MTEVKKDFDENEQAVEETEVVDQEQQDGTEEQSTAVQQDEVETVEKTMDDIVAEFTAKLEEEENKRLRMLADFENFKRRATLDQEALQKYRAQSLISNIIPVLDNFERALTLEAKTEEAQSMMTGMEMIHRTLVQALESEGLLEIEALDKEFDPNFHQAIMTGNDGDKSPGIVLEELQKGYQLKDRVLRPSMVKVNE